MPRSCCSRSISIPALKTTSPDSTLSNSARHLSSPLTHQVYLSRPNTKEADGSILYMFPNEARLRNLTYTAPFFVDMKKEVRRMLSDDSFQLEESDDEWRKVLVASVPVMLRSEYCSLKIDKMDDGTVFLF